MVKNMEGYKQKFDVIVIGGGFAGTAAALAAARENASVLLIEQGGALGGAAVNCLVNPFMRYWALHDDVPLEERAYVNKGIFLQIVNRLKEIGGIEKYEMIFHEEYLKIVLDRMMTEAGVTVLFHSLLIDSLTENGTVKAVTVSNKGGKQTFSADYFIDATGDADLTAMSGFPYHVGREADGHCQPMTLCFRIGNIDMETFSATYQTITPLYQKMKKLGKIKNPREDVLMIRNMVYGTIHFNTTRIVKRNPLDPFDLSRAEMEAREQVFEMYYFLKEHAAGFQNSDLIMSAPQIGVRESRMIDGLYTLTKEDILSCKKFEDAVAAGNYMIDIHNPDGTGSLLINIPKGDYYTIPYRSLIPQGASNLLTAGRCISASHEAQAACRIMPICCCMGEGAGAAAGLAAAENIAVSEVDTHQLQSLLKKYGAFLPE